MKKSDIAYYAALLVVSTVIVVVGVRHLPAVVTEAFRQSDVRRSEDTIAIHNEAIANGRPCPHCK